MVAAPMRPILRSRPVQIGLVVVVVAMGALGFVPLFGGPGYESSLGGGVILAFAVSITAALAGSSDPAPPVDALYRGLATGGLLAFAAWITTLVHGVRVGFCDALTGSESFALGPGVGALVAGTWGALAGEGARGRKWRRTAAVLIGLAGPLASILLSVWRFYASPMIFAYDPFVGYFSGTLYDTLIDFSGLLSYRAGSAATLFAAVVLALHLGRDATGRVRLRSTGRLALAIAGVLAASASLLANLYGYRLGHWQTSETIAAKLGGRTEGVRCSVVHARSLRPADAERFARDCDAHVAAHERWFGAPFLDWGRPGRITAFVFESSAQKGALMGAADTFIAKPWRREIYVQSAPYPHPVLGHELAHVVAGAFGQGPFRVAGSLGGLIPNPGLIEGVAVAAEPPEGELLPREWAKAMKDLGLLPRLDHLFTLGFLGENAGTAYTVSGAFVTWIRDRFGADTMRAWYGGRPLPEATGVSWADLESAWRDDLDKVELPEAARAVAKARFDRPGIFRRRCPHVVDGCRARGDQLRNAGDYEGAVAAYEQLLDLDPHDEGTRLAIARVRLREDRPDEASAALRRLSEDIAVPRHLRDRAVEDLADLALQAGRGEEAATGYRAVMAHTLDEDALRTLDVKIAAAGDDRLRPAVVALLVGSPGRGPDRAMAMELLGQVAVDPANGDGLPFYLLGRQYVPGNYDEAAARLDRALALPTKLNRVRIEAERLRMVIACAGGDGDGAARFFAAYTAHPEVSASRRGAARALVERCAARAGTR
jgi:tetratricopeptide (TPR) repeat protein